jgi:hypothetical protein
MLLILHRNTVGETTDQNRRDTTPDTSSQHHSKSITAPFWRLLGYSSVSDMLYRRYLHPNLQRFNKEEFPELIKNIKGKTPELIDTILKHLWKKSNPYVVAGALAGESYILYNWLQNRELPGVLRQSREVERKILLLSNKIDDLLPHTKKSIGSDEIIITSIKNRSLSAIPTYKRYSIKLIRMNSN